MFGRKIIVCLVSLVAVTTVMAHPSKNWASNGWTTEPSQGSGWEKTEAKFSDSWKQAAPAGDDSLGKGWVSSESSTDSKTKAIPTSWQKVERHHGPSVKSNGWGNAGQKAAINPASQEIANGIVVHHPVPSSDHWNQLPLATETWDKQTPAEYWPGDTNKKSSGSLNAVWDKSTAQDQWQQNQAPSPWDSKSAWDSSVLNDRESAAGYAASGPAEYGHGSIAGSGWENNSPAPADAWNKPTLPSALYDAPSKWDSMSAGIGNGGSGWQKPSSGWDSESDYKTWQKETSGWADSEQGHPASNGWQQGTPDLSTQKPWQKDTSSNGWQNKGNANGWD